MALCCGAAAAEAELNTLNPGAVCVLEAMNSSSLATLEGRLSPTWLLNPSVIMPRISLWNRAFCIIFNTMESIAL